MRTARERRGASTQSYKELKSKLEEQRLMRTEVLPHVCMYDWYCPQPVNLVQYTCGHAAPRQPGAAAESDGVVALRDIQPSGFVRVAR